MEGWQMTSCTRGLSASTQWQGNDEDLPCNLVDAPGSAGVNYISHHLELTRKGIAPAVMAWLAA